MGTTLAETPATASNANLSDIPEARSAPPLMGVLAAFAAVYLIWGSTYLAIRVAVETLPPLLMAGVRFVTAGTLLFAWLRFWGATWPTAAHWRSAAVVGGLLLLGGNGLVVWAQQYVPSGPAALLVATVPIWMVLLHALGPRGVRPGLLEIGGLLLGLLGLVVLVYPAALGLSGQAVERIDPWGAAALVLASLSWSVGSLYSRHATLPQAPLVATAIEMICGGGMQIVAGLLLGEAWRFNPAGVTWQSLAAMGYLIVFGSWIGFSAYVWLLRVAPPARVATYAYVNPVVAVLLGWLILSEAMTTLKIAAMALIVTAVVLITMRRRRTPSET